MIFIRLPSETCDGVCVLALLVVGGVDGGLKHSTMIETSLTLIFVPPL